MKTILLSVWLAFSITSCHKTDQIDPSLDDQDNLLTDYTRDLQQAKDWLPGKWKLTKVYAMVPNTTVPAVELVINEKQIRLIQDGIQTDVVDYETVKTDYGLLIKTNALPREDNWYVRNPGLYINKSRMYFDLGRALDRSAYEFEKVK